MIKNILRYEMFLVLLAGLTAIIMCGCNASKADEVNDMVLYADELLDLKFDDFIEFSEGEILKESNGENARIKLKLIKGMENAAIEYVGQKYKLRPTVDDYSVPGYRGHKYADEIKAGEIKAITGTFLNSKDSKKTRQISIYFVKKAEETYIYIMG